MTTHSPAPASTRSVVEVEALTKRYGNTAAVDSLTFDVPAGEVVGLLGPNGAGKTTAMKMLLGLITPSSGRATVLGADHGEPDYAHAVRRVGALIESPGLYERLTARQNIELQTRALGLRSTTVHTDELLHIVDLTSRAGDQARTYSLGMKQRLGIAVAMVGHPELVILDEPANGLDPAGIVEIRKLLRRLPDMGTTVLVSSHQLSEVQQACDRLLILAKGRLIAAGTTEQILAGSDRHELTVSLDPSELDAAAEQCRRQLLTVTAQTENSLTIVLPENWSGRDLNQSLVEAGIYARKIVHQSASLEDTFLELTGANHDQS